MKLSDLPIQLPGEIFGEATKDLSFEAKIVYGLIYQAYTDMYYAVHVDGYFEGSERYANDPGFYCLRAGLSPEKALEVEKELKDKGFIKTRVDTKPVQLDEPTVKLVTDVLVSL